MGERFQRRDRAGRGRIGRFGEPVPRLRVELKRSQADHVTYPRPRCQRANATTSLISVRQQDLDADQIPYRARGRHVFAAAPKPPG